MYKHTANFCIENLLTRIELSAVQSRFSISSEEAAILMGAFAAHRQEYSLPSPETKIL